MCGRYVSPDEAEMERAFHLGRHNWKGWIKKYNAGPTMQVPVIYQAEGEHVGDIARWGLIPSWWSKDTLPTLTFNARSEEAAVKPMWRQSIKSARCLMPAKGWYEWNENEPVLTASGRKGHQPYYFHPAEDEVIAIAGLWSVWQSATGASILSCALLTKEASASNIAEIHHRMPVILTASEYDAWLAPEASPRAVTDLIAASRSDFIAHRVSTRVNNTRNDAPDLIDAI